MAAVRGNKLILTLDGEDRAVELTAYELSHGDDNGDDVLTFGEAAAGVSSATLSFTAVQNLGNASLWRYVWTNSGTEVPFRIAAMGNDLATAEEVHVTGTVTIGPRPSLGGEAAVRGPRFTFEAEWQAKVDATLASSGTATTV